MDWLSLVAFVAFGSAVGTYGTLIGAGGGFIIVPVLVLFLGWPHTEAVATSLLVVTANAASGTISYWRQGRVDFWTGVRFALATVPGAVAGSYLVALMSGRIFNLVFGSLLVIVSIYLIVRPERRGTNGDVSVRPTGTAGWLWTVRELTDAKGEHYRYAFSTGWGILLSLGVGFLSSILGIGGGIVHVPALVTLFGFPAHIATATSHFILVFSALTGTLSQHDHIRLGPGIAMAIGAVAGAQVGGRLSSRIRGRWIMRGLAAALTLVGLRLILG